MEEQEDLPDPRPAGASGRADDPIQLPRADLVAIVEAAVDRALSARGQAPGGNGEGSRGGRGGKWGGDE